MDKNLKIIWVFLLALMFALSLRLAYIQILGHDDLWAAVRAQSLISLEGSNTRGIIYDRNGDELVADKKHYVYIIKEDGFDDKARRLLESIGADEVSGHNEGYHVYSSRDYDKETGRKLIENHGTYILEASSRYSEDQPAEHLIGYVNSKDSSGAAGLELMYDDRLSGLNRKMYAVADVKGNILPGRGLLITSDAQQDSFVREGIRTTLDKGLQENIEELISSVENDCAVVVLDSGTGGVAAMACTPGFDPNNITEHMKSSGDELMNKAAQGEYPPGSIFKIVVAAAALESGIAADKTYYCSGRATLDGLVIGCDTGGDAGHGEISFEDAFAQSCNSFFVALGQETGADAITEMAEKMGFGEKVLDGYPQESSGHVMTNEERAGNAIGNLSIGQGEMLATPLQVAAMTNMIACGGVDKGVHLLMEEEQENVQVISQNTAETIGDMMELTSENGTGRGLGLVSEDGTIKAAVKTGTAEYSDGDEMKTHGWITGYTPCDEAEFVITVLVEEGSSGAGAAGPIFEKIIEYLEESGSYSMPTLA